MDRLVGLDDALEIKPIDSIQETINDELPPPPTSNTKDMFVKPVSKTKKEAENETASNDFSDQDEDEKFEPPKNDEPDLIETKKSKARKLITQAQEEPDWECECGITMKQRNRTRHLASRRHQKRMEILNAPDPDKMVEGSKQRSGKVVASLDYTLFEKYMDQYSTKQQKILEERQKREEEERKIRQEKLEALAKEEQDRKNYYYQQFKLEQEKNKPVEKRVEPKPKEKSRKKRVEKLLGGGEPQQFTFIDYNTY